MIVDFPRIAFFDRKFDERPSIEEIVEDPIAFQICVMKYAVGKQYWTVIGNTDVPSEVMSADRFFKFDQIARKFSIYEAGGTETPATFSDVADLECAAVWDPEHVESRLEDHYAGIENKWVKLLAPTNKMQNKAEMATPRKPSDQF